MVQSFALLMQRFRVQVPDGPLIYNPVTQLAEYDTFNIGVTGSSPVWITKYSQVAQLVSAGVLYTQGYGFKSHPDYKNIAGCLKMVSEQSHKLSSFDLVGSSPTPATKCIMFGHIKCGRLYLAVRQIAIKVNTVIHF